VEKSERPPKKVILPVTVKPAVMAGVELISGSRERSRSGAANILLEWALVEMFERGLTIEDLVDENKRREDKLSARVLGLDK
jgi:hypothetical protein